MTKKRCVNHWGLFDCKLYIYIGKRFEDEDERKRKGLKKKTKLSISRDMDVSSSKEQLASLTY